MVRERVKKGSNRLQEDVIFCSSGIVVILPACLHQPHHERSIPLRSAQWASYTGRTRLGVVARFSRGSRRPISACVVHAASWQRSAQQAAGSCAQ